MKISVALGQIYTPTIAAEYASYWCDGRNTNNWIKDPYNFNIVWGYPYNNYSNPPYNGDCANFVSQCLKAGGLDLSLGAYGIPGGTGEVDNRGCIKGATELMEHLTEHQVPKPDKKIVLGYKECPRGY